ncbi:MAG: NrfD/PsrC family molybdoenzyme membrane anchor subunit [Dehalococcoidales bacterium]|jgi:formate-dependent nitrite reductase membrane component NrfD|nr:polysulfide reductase NrfD [Dehalococcoidales bacterium]
MNIGGMEWGVTLWIDLWAAGMAGGAFLTAFLADKFSGGKLKNLFKLAVCTGIILALIGVALLLSHLGNILWFWHMFVTFRPESVLSLGGWILSGWLMVAGIMLVLWLASHYIRSLKPLADKATSILSWVGFVMSILLMSYTGVLISASTQPFWAVTPMLPAVFVVSAITSGVAWLIVVSLIVNWLNRTNIRPYHWVIEQFFDESGWQIESSAIAKLAKSLVIAIIIELIVIALFILWLSASGSPAATDGLALLTGGELSLWFWVGLIAAGLVAPLIMLGMNLKKDYSTGILAGITFSSAGLVVLGGLLIRALLLIAGQA